MSSKYPIPLLFIDHKLFYDQEIKTVHQVARKIDPGGAKGHHIRIEPAPIKATLALYEMTRVTVMTGRQQTGLVSLYTSWMDLGYDPQAEHLLLSNETSAGLFNAKMSMLLRRECFGLWALVPLQVWNIAKQAAK